MGESPTLSDGLCLAVDKDELLPRGTPHLNGDRALEVEIYTNWISSYSNYPTRLEFNLDVDSRLSVLKVAT